jgi:acetyltransferase
MWRYSDNLRLLYETPALSPNPDNDLSAQARTAKIIAEAQESDRTLLTEVESKEVLEAYGIPTIPTLIARTENEAVLLAKKLGEAIVLKLYSEIITHKTEVGGVKLNLRSEAEVRLAYRSIEEAVRSTQGAFLGVTVEPMLQAEGYELILGSSVDSQFGPVLLFGSGGQLVEVMKDYALGLPPLNATLARRLMERTHVYTALRGVRGRAAIDLVQLERVLVRFSLLVAEQPRIKEIDINPFVVWADRDSSPSGGEGGMLALDARIVLHDAKVADATLPRLAIRPYPQQYVTNWQLKDGTPLTLRPIRPEDEPLMVKFHGTLSEDTVRLRYFGFPKLEQRVTHERLTRICFNDYDREIALIAVRKNPETKADEIVGIGRLIKMPGIDEAEFAIVISDQVHGQGLGTQFLKLLVDVGRKEGIGHITSLILPDNYVMQRVSRNVGFEVTYDRYNDAMRADITVTS